MYIYPDNLKSKAVLWLWELRDIAIIGVGALISVFAMAQLGFLPPVVITAAYAFLSIRLEDTSILDFLRYAVRYFLLGQQTYAWGLCNPTKVRSDKNEQKKEAKAKQTTRQLIGIDEITDSGLQTSHGRLVFFAIKPTNLSVQPPDAVSSRIYALMTVLKGQAEIEMLALNSKESFEDNKRHYRQRAAEEDLPVISRLLEADAKSLDRLQIQMATAREFFVLVRLREETGMELHTHLSRIQKSLEDQGFKASLASGEDLKRMLGVYFEQNATTEKYEDYDGERWIILND